MREVLLVDTDRHFSTLLVDGLSDVARVHVVASAQAAIDWLDKPKRRCDLVISELSLGSHSGVEIIHELRSHHDWLHLPVLIHSRIARLDELTRDRLQQDYGVVGYVQKGVHSVADIRETVTSLVPA